VKPNAVVRKAIAGKGVKERFYDLLIFVKSFFEKFDF